MIRHGHGIYCLHVYGWCLARWCSVCRRSWETFEQPEHCSRAEGFRRHCDAMLARAIFAAIESGQIAWPVGYDVEDLRPLPDWVREPSPN